MSQIENEWGWTLSSTLSLIVRVSAADGSEPVIQKGKLLIKVGSYRRNAPIDDRGEVRLSTGLGFSRNFRAGQGALCGETATAAAT
jgi:hypothetical protein